VVNWVHPPKRETDQGCNASVNLDMVIGIVIEETLVGTISEESVSGKTEVRINFLTAAEYSPYWIFEEESDMEKALSILRRANAWK
jgi:hypothetical protein